MPPFDNSMIKDQVLSWLHDEETTVTAQKIQQECVGEDPEDGSEMGVSRKGASDLLRALYESKPKDYTATVCNVTTSSSNANTKNDSNAEEDIVQTTVFSWQQLEPGNSLENTADSTILALSKSSSAEQSPLEASHEQDMNTLRDRLFGNADTADHAWFYKHQQLCHVLVNPLQDGTEATAPAVQEEKTWHKVERTPIVRPKTTSNNNSIASAFSKKPAPTKKAKDSSAGSSSSSNNTITKVKPTTAKSFFTQKPAAKSGASASKPKAKPVAKPPKSNDDDDSDDNESQRKKPATAASKSSAFAKRVRPTADKENTDTEDQHNVGNADDFVGDEDEDSEDELDMEQRREKSKEIVRKQKKQDELLDELVQEQQHDMEEEKPVLVRGAMDAFATKTSSPKKKAALGNSTSNKKRRKVLKEKTTVDKNGYLVTTTETIWEDCSSDEEDVKKKAVARPTKSKQQPVTKAIKKKKATDMRQGSLMGFFKPKAK